MSPATQAFKIEETRRDRFVSRERSFSVIKKCRVPLQVYITKIVKIICCISLLQTSLPRSYPCGGQRVAITVDNLSSLAIMAEKNVFFLQLEQLQYSVLVSHNKESRLVIIKLYQNVKNPS